MDQKIDQGSIAAPPGAKPLAKSLGWLTDRFGWRLSPVNRRRLQRFKAHKLGYRSFQIFLALFVVTLFAEFIANDRPLIASYKGEILFSGACRLPGREIRRLSCRHRLPARLTFKTRSTPTAGWSGR